MISRNGYGLIPDDYREQMGGGLLGRLRDLLEQHAAASFGTFNEPSQRKETPEVSLVKSPPLDPAIPAMGPNLQLTSQLGDSNFRQLSRIVGGEPTAFPPALGGFSAASEHQALVAPATDGSRSTGPSQYAMGRSKHDKCVDQCLYLLPSPSGDLQSSEYRKCYRECMGLL